MRCLYIQMHTLQKAQHDSGATEAVPPIPVLLQAVDPSTSRSPPALYRWNPGIGLHFYTSAQPCGNASIKRWAKGKTEKWHDLPPDQLPHLPHERIQLHARKEGQAMFLVKRFRPAANQREGSPHGGPDSETAPSLDIAAAGSSETPQVCKKQEGEQHLPAACAAALTGNGQTASCSDKIARWNVLGVQGGLMLNILSEPVYMQSITIGHKCVPWTW